MKTSATLSVAASLFFALNASLKAQPVTYTDSASFISAIASMQSFTTNFISMGLVGQIQPITNPTNYSGNAFSYTVTAPPTFDGGLFGINGAGTTNNGVIPSGSWIQASDGPDALSLTNFSAPGSLGVTGIGGYWFRTDFNGVFQSNSLVNVIVDYDGGSYTNTVTPSGGLSQTFFGILGVSNISSVRVTGTDANYSTMANVTVVPEPSTYALLGLAAACLAGYVIRRRRA
jgi:hypothetical protein